LKSLSITVNKESAKNPSIIVESISRQEASIPSDCANEIISASISSAVDGKYSRISGRKLHRTAPSSKEVILQGIFVRKHATIQLHIPNDLINGQKSRLAVVLLDASHHRDLLGQHHKDGIFLSMSHQHHYFLFFDSSIFVQSEHFFPYPIQGQ